MRSRHSDLIDRTNRFAEALALGAWNWVCKRDNTLTRPLVLESPDSFPVADQHAMAYQRAFIRGRECATDLAHRHVGGIQRRAANPDAVRARSITTLYSTSRSRGIHNPS